MTDTLRDRFGTLVEGEDILLRVKFLSRRKDGYVDDFEIGVYSPLGGYVKMICDVEDAQPLAAQPAPAVIGEERDTLIDHYYQDQGVTPEGELRPLVSKLLKRVERAEAALARTAATENREEPQGDESKEEAPAWKGRWEHEHALREALECCVEWNKIHGNWSTNLENIVAAALASGMGPGESPT